jgi:hypothetical protein
MKFMSSGEAAKAINHRARDVSTHLYFKGLAGIEIQIVGGRRLIPEWALPQLKAELEAAGKVPAENATEAA